MNFFLQLSGLVFKITGTRMVPESDSCLTGKVEMFNMFTSSEGPAISPGITDDFNSIYRRLSENTKDLVFQDPIQRFQ
nr:unnamed protein product [Callosobruchus analis]